ncbi:hypothetical protein S245_067050, partial [Arachis hypogaea]
GCSWSSNWSIRFASWETLICYVFPGRSHKLVLVVKVGAAASLSSSLSTPKWLRTKPYFSSVATSLAATLVGVAPLFVWFFYIKMNDDLPKLQRFSFFSVVCSE